MKDSIKISNIDESELASIIEILEKEPTLTIREADKSHLLSRLLQSESSICLKALNNGNVIATAFVGVDGKRAYLYHLWVHQDYRL